MGGISYFPSHGGITYVRLRPNAKQVQHWLGHHAASFTLDTYVHLLEGDLGDPLSPAASRRTT